MTISKNTTLLKLMNDCDVNSKKALRLGGKDLMGAIYSWQMLGLHRLTHDWSASELKSCNAWAKEWSEKFKETPQTIFSGRVGQVRCQNIYVLLVVLLKTISHKYIGKSGSIKSYSNLWKIR